MDNATRLQELEQILTDNCKNYEDNCNTCPFKAQCEEYDRLKRTNN